MPVTSAGASVSPQTTRDASDSALDLLADAADQERNNASANGERPRKRRRIAIACSSCRYRKSRCDGGRPKCSTCIDLGYDCVYAQSGPIDKTVVPKSYLDSIESRLSTVEGTLRTLSSKLEERDVVGVQKHNGSSAKPSALCIAIRDGVAVEEEYNDTVPTQEPTDGMGSIGFTEEDDSVYFGPSSNIAFTRRIVRAITATMHTQPSIATPSSHGGILLDSHILHVSRPPSPANRKPGWADENGDPETLFILPPEEETLRLIRHYFANTGVLFPYIHEESFLATYEELKAGGFRKARRSWLGLLNMILAMSTNASIHISAEERAAKTDIFFSRAMALCAKQIRHGTSLETLQFLLLMGQYLQGTEQSVRTWNLHGLAVKVAYQLGVHSKDALKQFPPVEREVRLRTWFGCIILDRTLSMTLGRPSAIPENYIKLELPRDYAELTSSSGDVVAVSSAKEPMWFFNATITLYHIMYKVIDSLYGGNLGCDNGSNIFDIASCLLQTEQQLLEWQRNLPSALPIVLPSELPLWTDKDATTVLRFRVILTLRYQNLRILAHRPVLVKFLDHLASHSSDYQQLRMLQQVGVDSLQTCIQSASAIISIVSHIVHSTGPQRGLLGAWWFSLYYTFNSALVIFSALLICHNERSLSPSFALNAIDVREETLQEAVDSILLLDKGNRMAEKCAKYASKLVQILDSLEPLSSNANNADSMAANPAAANASAAAPDALLEDDGPPAFSFFSANQTPLGFDMSEFMVPSDLDFLANFSNRGFY